VAKPRQARIRLLVDVFGSGAVQGRAGAVLTVDAATARAWADGERAERVIDRSPDIETTEG
jgi:hypothetical protein